MTLAQFVQQISAYSACVALRRLHARNETMAKKQMCVRGVRSMELVVIVVGMGMNVCEKKGIRKNSKTIIQSSGDSRSS